MPSLLNDLFVRPGMLWGLLAVLVPIIIYLINRRRYQRRRWAAMEFLLRAVKRHRRKLQLQNLLLLLVRVALIALLALGLARPIQRKGKIAAAPDRNQSWVFAVDTSYSMGYQGEGASLLDRARDTIRRLSETILKPGDQVALVSMEKRPQVLLAPTRLAGDGLQKFLAELGEVELTSGPADLGASFAVLDELCGKIVTESGDPEPKRIVLFSDFQRKDWLDGEGKPLAGLPQYIEKIQGEGGEFAFAELAPTGARGNLAVVELVASPTLVARDVWVELRATVRNFSTESLEDVDLTIQVDSDPEDASTDPQMGDVIRVPARGSVSRILPYRFTTPGYHTAVAELRSDGLLIDNRRYLALRVAEDVRVLLVDGDPASFPIDRETVHVEIALAPESYSGDAPSGRFTPYQTEYVTGDQLRDVELSQFSVVVLANVADLPLEQVEALRRYVRGGGAAMVFLGSNVRADFYNQHLAQDGFLPGKLGEARGDPRYPVYLEVADPSHPVARYFEAHRDATHLFRPVIAFGRYVQVSGLEGESPSARVLFRYTDASRSPAVFDNAYGSGRVLWMTSTADQEWNEFSSWPDFVVFLHEAVSYLVRFGQSSSNLGVGEPFQRVYSSVEYASEVRLRTPEPLSGDLRRSRNVQKAMQAVAGGNEFRLEHEDTSAPGLYRLDFIRTGVSNADSVEHFAVNVDTSESDLTSMSEDDFRSGFENLRYQSFDASERIRRIEGERELLRGREFWRWLLFGVLGLVIVETILGLLFGRRST